MLEVNGVNSFYGKAQVLNDLNFTVDRGTVATLLGAMVRARPRR